MNILFLIVSIFILFMGTFAFMVVGIWMKTSLLLRFVMFHLPGLISLVLTYMRWKGNLKSWHVIVGVIASIVLLFVWVNHQLKVSSPRTDSNNIGTNVSVEGESKDEVY